MRCIDMTLGYRVGAQGVQEMLRAENSTGYVELADQEVEADPKRMNLIERW